MDSYTHRRISLRTRSEANIVFLATAFFSLLLHRTAAISDPNEAASLLAIKKAIGDGLNKLSNWDGDDPCGTTQWTGVYCTTIDGVQHVQELRLLNKNFTGFLSPDFGNLTELTILNVMWNNLTGSIPPEIGKLTNLSLLLLNGNALSGTMPPALGNLSKLKRLQIDLNNMSGSVPASFQNLSSVQHIHLNNNSLSGSIPKELGQLPNLLHLLLDTNDLSGELPSELSNISTLVILQLDNNHFNGSIPSTYSNMLNLSKLSLRNCNLSGTIPDFSNLTYLAYLDLSQNQLIGSLPVLRSGSLYLRKIELSFNKLDGNVSTNYFQILNLEHLILENNSLNGNILANQMTHNAFTASESVILDFRNNDFTEYTDGGYSSSSNVTIRLYGNPLCSESSVPKSLCQDYNGSDTNYSSVTPTTQNLVGCSEDTCDTANNQELVNGLLALGQCHCAYPLGVGYRLKSPSFAVFQPHEDAFIEWISSGLKLDDYQVYVSEYNWEPGPRLGMSIKLFPTNTTSEFVQTEVDYLYSVLSNWSMPANNTFGPYELLSFTIGYPYDGSSAVGTSNEKGLSGGAIAGIVIGAVAATAIAVAVATFLVVRRRYPYASAARPVRHYERIKVAGLRSFSFEEMVKATNNFDSSMEIGQGGYGKVYKAVLADGLLVAVKRAQEGSLQGSKEFYTEIDLLSRVHHRNLVALIGYCDDEGEQMLVYEFMANGTLRAHLSPQSNLSLDFPTRLQIALGSAKGILYLHTEANPPIYHRDIKASNILLDDKRKAKVADFGLSKLAPIAELEGDVGGYVSTVVKGTPGYLDPEYFFTHQLTDKSDVYSFGVVLLELVTGMQPIYQGKNLVREVTLANEGGKVLSMVDPRMGKYASECILSLIELAISCCNDDTDCRPSMAEVVRILVSIWQSLPLLDLTAFSETSVETEGINLKHHQSPPPSTSFIPSDADNSGLFSGVILEMTPR